MSRLIQEPLVAVKPRRPPQYEKRRHRNCFQRRPCKHFQKSKHLLRSEVRLMRSNSCRSSTASIYMLSVTDFEPTRTISEVRVRAGPPLDILRDADRSPNADSPRRSRNRLITMVKLKKEILKKSFEKRKNLNFLKNL